MYKTKIKTEFSRQEKDEGRGTTASLGRRTIDKAQSKKRFGLKSFNFSSIFPNFSSSALNNTFHKSFHIFITLVLLFVCSSTASAQSLEDRLINPDTRKAALKELWDQGESANSKLKEMLKSNNSELKMIALVRIVNLKSSAFVAEATEILRNETDMKIMKKAMQYCCVIKEKSVIPVLKDKIQNSNVEKEKRYAIQAITIIVINEEQSYKDDVINTLKETLNDISGRVRMEGAFQLATLDDNSGYEVAVNDLNDSNPLVRERAVEVLGEIGNLSAMSLIEQALQDSEIWVRTKAKIAKEKLELVKAVMPRKKKMSRKMMSAQTKSNKIEKLREILNSNKILDIKIWAANEMLDMGEEGKLAADEIIKNNEQGGYVMHKEMGNRR